MADDDVKPTDVSQLEPLEVVNAGPSEDVPVDKLQEVVQDPGKVFSLVEEAEECEKLALLAGHQRSGL